MQSAASLGISPARPSLSLYADFENNNISAKAKQRSNAAALSTLFR